MMNDEQREAIKVSLEAQGYRWQDVDSLLDALPATLESAGLGLVTLKNPAHPMLDGVRASSRAVSGRPRLIIRSADVDGVRIVWLDELDGGRYVCRGAIAYVPVGGES